MARIHIEPLRTGEETLSTGEAGAITGAGPRRTVIITTGWNAYPVYPVQPFYPTLQVYPVYPVVPPPVIIQPAPQIYYGPFYRWGW